MSWTNHRPGASGKFRPSGWILFAIALIGLASTGRAHHIMGTPHYAYDEQYPQTPVLTYLAQAGDCEIEMMGYPGEPKPGERWTLHVYIRDEESKAFGGALSLRILREKPFARDEVIYGPTESGVEEAVFKFYPRFEEIGRYRMEVTFESGGEPWTIEMPIVVGDPPSIGGIVAAAGAGIFVLAVLSRAFLIKRRRRLARLHARAPNEDGSTPSQTLRPGSAA